METDDKSQIEFNFCGEMKPRQQCADSTGKATLKTPGNDCYNLGGSDTDNGHPIRRENSDEDKDLEKGGLTVMYQGGDECTIEGLHYSLDIEVYCSD